MYVSRRLRLLPVLIALTLVSAACGGDDAGSDATSTTAADATTTTITTATTTTSTTTTIAVSGDSGSEWCVELRRAQEDDGANPFEVDFSSLSPEGIQARLEAALALFQGFAERAPAEIDSEVDTFVRFFDGFVEAGNAADWDLMAMSQDPDFMAAASDPTLEAAADKIDAYAREVCGVDFSDSAPGPTPPADAVTILLGQFGIPPGLFTEEDIQCMRDQLGPEFEAKITTDYVITPDDTAALLAAVTACGISLG